MTGALVTSNDAGLSVPDWPLSHGSLFPEMVGGVLYEHSHRLVAATVGLLTLILAIWLGRAEPRLQIRRLGWVALGLVLTQALLGGVGVLLFLPLAISVMHACLAQLFFCVLVAIALMTGPSWRDRSLSYRRPGEYRHETLFAGVAAATVYLQLILGALLRHMGASEGSKGVTVVTHVLLSHLGMAFLVGALLLVTAVKILKRPELQICFGKAYVLILLLIFQFALGFAAYWVRLVKLEAPEPFFLGVALTSAHLAVGAALLAVILVVALELFFLDARRAGNNSSDLAVG